MKKWAVVGILAAAIIGFLLIGKYQDMKYPIEPDGENPPVDPNASLRHIDVDTIHFYDADGQDITDQIPWNGMRPWDGSSSVSQK